MGTTLSPSQTAALTALHNRPTRYEAVLTLPNGTRLLVGYSPRHTKAGLLDAIRNVGPAILAKMPDLTDDHVMTYSSAGFDFGNGAKVAWSGRTQRDAIMHGTLPFVGEG